MTREEAKSQYRICWDSYRKSFDDSERAALGAEMDALQPLIADEPRDTNWIEFAQSLDGYLGFWKAAPSILEANLRDIIRSRK